MKKKKVNDKFYSSKKLILQKFESATFRMAFSVVVLLIVSATIYLTVQIFNRRTEVNVVAPSSAQLADNLVDFAYPRGTKPAYGWYDCGQPNSSTSPDQCITDQYTVIHDWYGSPVNSTLLKSHTDYFKNRSRAKQFMPYTGYHPNRDNNGGDTQYWEGLFSGAKNLGLTDNDVLGFYYGDEPHSVNEVKYTHQVQKKYFPNALSIVYGVNGMMPVDPLTGYQDGFEYMPYIDVTVTSSYPHFEESVMGFPTTHASTYILVNDVVKAWKLRGKTVWHAPETFQGACQVLNDPNLNSKQKIYNKVTSEIVLSTIAGAQGILPYSYYFVAGRADGYPNPEPECYTAIRDFLPKYTEIWTWIMAGNKVDMPVNISNGSQTYLPPRNDWSYRIGAYPRVIAKLFTNSQDQKMLLTSSMMSWKESSATDMGTISNIPNGTWKVMWENRTINVTNGTISDSWSPYQYHVYVLQDGLVPLPPPTQPPATTNPKPVPQTPVPQTAPPAAGNNSTGNLKVVAAGSVLPGTSMPSFEVRYKDSLIASQLVTGQLVNYSFTVPSNAQIQDFKIVYTNDISTNTTNRDLRVDSVTLNNITYSSTASDTYSTGTWSATDNCAPGFKSSVWLHCNGYFQYKATTATAAPTVAPTLIPTPIPTKVPTVAPTQTATPKPTAVPTPVATVATNFTPKPTFSAAPIPTEPPPQPQQTADTNQSQIKIYAAGQPAKGIWPKLGITVIGEQTGDIVNIITRDVREYSYTPRNNAKVKQLQFNFINDYYEQQKDIYGNVTRSIDRNLRIQKVVQNGSTYNATDDDTYSQGSWTASNGCSSTGFLRAEWLHCQWGYFRFDQR